MTLVNVGPERFDVWAPDASSVVLQADGRQYPMVEKKDTEPGAEGWWTAPDAPADGDVDYGYLLDGDTTPIPDPRSGDSPPACMSSPGRTIPQPMHGRIRAGAARTCRVA